MHCFFPYIIPFSVICCSYFFSVFLRSSPPNFYMIFIFFLVCIRILFCSSIRFISKNFFHLPFTILSSLSIYAIVTVSYRFSLLSLLHPGCCCLYCSNPNSFGPEKPNFLSMKDNAVSLGILNQSAPVQVFLLCFSTVTSFFFHFSIIYRKLK